MSPRCVPLLGDFMIDDITDADKLQCAERELALRKRVYPRFVEQKKMSLGRSELEIAIMAAIADDYRAKVNLVPPGLEDF